MKSRDIIKSYSDCALQYNGTLIVLPAAQKLVPGNGIVKGRPG